ncbi:MAG TPA: GGDEF domain-containing protein [Candidatus Sulfotelmatobacter sp.]|nr:GGDEF domain-containing protein [Candidatus Sulfotelmatobacter sp.]
MPIRLRWWPAILWMVACLQLLLSLLARKGFALAAFGDILQTSLLLATVIAVFPRLRIGTSKTRLFWGLMGLGFGTWFCAQALWTYFEVVLRRGIPNPFAGDVVFFLHIVPMMAAVAVQPHLEQDNRTRQAGTLDFILLLTWWLYLYLFAVIPWQFVSPNEAIYGRSFDLLYGCEQLVFLLALALVWMRSCGGWRRTYARLVGAALVYSTGSMLASEAIDRHIYYTGSLFDVPLVCSMIWFVLIASNSGEKDPPTTASVDGHAIWEARLAMLAVFLTPLMVAWAQFAPGVPERVRSYRLILTVAVMIVMGGLVFLKQHLLDHELLSLLRSSREHLDETCKLKDELQDKEQSLRWHSLELQRKNLELQEISFTDALTGVWNRRYLEEILGPEADQVLRNYQRAGTQKMDHRDLVFLMVDVDFFKSVNDQYGHPAGDRLLQLVAERLSKIVRRSDVLFRWGGEEFLIMSRSTDPSGIPAFCSRILEVVAGEPFDLGQGIVVRKTCSVGWAPFPWIRNACDAICAEEVIIVADAALYRAKHMGRNQGIGFIPSDAALADPAAIALAALTEAESHFVQVVRTECRTHAVLASQSSAPAPHSHV